MRKSTKENTTTTTNGTALLSEPSYDSRELLNDPEQLRAIIKALSIQLEAFVDAPELLQIKQVQEALELEALALHVVTCEDCGDVRRDSGEHIPMDKLRIVQKLFLTLDDIIQKDKAYASGESEELVGRLRSVLQRRSTTLTAVTPLND